MHVTFQGIDTGTTYIFIDECLLDPPVEVQLENCEVHINSASWVNIAGTVSMYGEESCYGWFGVIAKLGEWENVTVLFTVPSYPVGTIYLNCLTPLL